MLEKLFLLKVLEKLGAFAQHCYTILIILISWVIFAFENLKLIGTYLSTMFNLNGVQLINSEALYYAKNYFIPIMVGGILSVPLAWKLLEKLEKKSNFFAILFYIGILVLCTASLVSDSYNPFLYFRF